jgi:hypothetical protein
MAKVLIRFRDKETWRLYDVGDDWEGSPERAETLSEGGYIQSGLIAHDAEENGSNGSTDAADAISSDMTVAQLREIAHSRGIDVPKRATKAKILELLGV